jgi:formylglycine-generating enzyme required for sulfatase activity
MKHTRLIASLLLAAATVPVASRAQTTNLIPPQIQNLLAAQRPSTMLVDITYDLVDPDSTNLYVIAEFSANNGTNYGMPISSFSGDIGPVRPGTGRKIVWNAWNDWAGNYTTNARIRLTADDSLSALPPPPTNAPDPNLVWIPSGTFNMQNNGRLVYISRGFWMGRFEVTQGEYMAIMTNNPSSHTGNTNLPVESMTWSNAVRYCLLRTAREQAAGKVATNWVYRLPTEAEWEYAARAGTTNQFSFGDDPGYVRLKAYAWFNTNSSGMTQLVGSKIPNRWGVFDMLGNVQEWCLEVTGYDAYNGGAQPTLLPSGNFTDPGLQWPPTLPNSEPRINRGGSYAFSGDYCQLARRYAIAVGGAPYTGFRVILAPNP